MTLWDWLIAALVTVQCICGVLAWLDLRRHLEDSYTKLVAKHEALHETTKHVAARQQFGVRGPVK